MDESDRGMRRSCRSRQLTWRAQQAKSRVVSLRSLYSQATPDTSVVTTTISSPLSVAHTTTISPTHSLSDTSTAVMMMMNDDDDDDDDNDDDDEKRDSLSEDRAQCATSPIIVRVKKPFALTKTPSSTQASSNSSDSSTPNLCLQGETESNQRHINEHQPIRTRSYQQHVVNTAGKDSIPQQHVSCYSSPIQYRRRNNIKSLSNDKTLVMKPDIVVSVGDDVNANIIIVIKNWRENTRTLLTLSKSGLLQTKEKFRGTTQYQRRHHNIGAVSSSPDFDDDDSCSITSHESNDIVDDNTLPLLLLAATVLKENGVAQHNNSATRITQTDENQSSQKKSKADSFMFTQPGDSNDYVLVLLDGRNGQQLSPSIENSKLIGDLVDDDGIDDCVGVRYSKDGSRLANEREFWIAPRSRLSTAELASLQAMHQHDIERCGNAEQRINTLNSLFRSVGFQRVRDLYASRRRSHTSIANYCSLIYFVRL